MVNLTTRDLFGIFACGRLSKSVTVEYKIHSYDGSQSRSEEDPMVLRAMIAATRHQLSMLCMKLHDESLKDFEDMQSNGYDCDLVIPLD